MCHICSNCFSDKKIQQIITNKGAIGNCDCCGRTNVFVADEDDLVNDIGKYCQLYIAYHYDEPQYNEHSGGNIYKLIETEKLFIEPSKIENTPCYALMDCILEENYGFLYSETSWAHATKDYCDYMFWESFKTDSSLKVQINKIDELYEEIKGNLEKEETRQPLYRARIGCIREKGHLPKPYSDKDIGAAPPSCCSEAGRANRPFVSFLYLAEDEETAITEVRATKGDVVSVGKFQPKNNLNIFNLAFPDLLACSQLKDPLHTLASIASLNNIFSRPTGSSNKNIYLPTQLFVEKLVSEKYDGICFKSSFTGKINFVIFEPEKAPFISNSSKLFYVNSLKCKFERVHDW